MTHDEALTVTEMVINSWPEGRVWTAEQITAYANGIHNLDAELAVHAVNLAQKSQDRRPSVHELRGYYQAVRTTREASSAPAASRYEKPEKLEPWVKRWAAARFFYDRFGRERDLRRFPEQHQYVDTTTEEMPADEWLEESQHLTDAEIRKAVIR
jgi:hypothetical protein